MKPIRPIASLWLWAFAACGGAEEAPRASGDPGIRAAAAKPAALSDMATADCEGGVTAGPDTGDVLSRNEIRSWARPDQPSSRPCNSGSTSPVADTDDPAEALPADSPAAAPAEARAGVTDPVAAGPVESTPVPLVPGLKIVSANHFPEGDRENVVVVQDVSPQGATYSWRFKQQGGQGPTEGEFQRFVRESDLAAAPRLNPVFGTRQRETPGYTSFSISRETYARLRAEGETRYTVVALQGGPLGGDFSGLLASRLTLKGALALASPEPEPMPMLLNGQRVRVPALHLTGRFAFQEHVKESDFWVLADSAHPLVLKVVTGDDVFQTIRIDLPEDPAPALERALEHECRAELPGIYFAFASAELEPASGSAIAGVASLLGRHPDWALAVEGHTDSIGNPRSNQALSLRRAEAVRTALVERHGIAAGRLQAAGFGAMRPREPNGTLEGRARNRRVELVRACPDGRA